MTSKRSSTDKSFIKDQIMLLHTRTWVVALTILVAIMHYIIIPGVMLMGSRMSLIQRGFDSVEIHERMIETANIWFGFSSFGNIFGVSALAIIMGIQAFSYLYNLKSVDFFDSHPISFKEQFFNRYVNSILIFAAVHFVGIFFGIAVCASTGAITGNLMGIMFLEFVRGLILFIGTYSIFVLAAVLSGNIFIAYLLGSFFTAVELVIKLIQEGCKAEYFATYNGGSDFFDQMKLFTSPMYYYYLGFGANSMFSPLAAMDNSTPIRVSNAISTSMSGMIATLILSAVVTGLAFAAFKQRPRESAGKGLCFGIMESAVKIIIATCAGILAAMTVDVIWNTTYSYTAIMFAVVIITVVLTCLIGEVIFNVNIASATKRAWQIPVIIVICFAFIVSYKQDIFGYDRKLPAASEVESAVFYTTSYGESDIIPPEGESRSMTATEFYKKNMKLTDIETVEKVAKLGMECQRKAAARNQKLSNADPDNATVEDYDGYNCEVHLKLKNGKTVSRCIMVPYDVDAADMDAIIGSDEYKSTYYDTKLVAESAPKLIKKHHGNYTISYDSLGDNTDSKKISSKDIQSLMAAYGKDVSEHYSFSFARKANVIGTIELTFNLDPSYRDKGEYSTTNYQRFVVFENYDNTIAALKKLGIYRSCVPEIDKIKTLSVTYSNPDFAENSDEASEADETRYYYHDAKKIKEIIKHARFNYGSCDWQSSSEDAKAEFYATGSYFHLSNPAKYDDDAEGKFIYSYTLDVKDAPQFLKKDFDSLLKK